MNWEDILKEEDLSRLNDVSKRLFLLCEELYDEIHHHISKSKIGGIIHELNVIQSEVTGTDDLHVDMRNPFYKLMFHLDEIREYAAALSDHDAFYDD